MCALVFKSSHHPDVGKLLTYLPDSRMHNCGRRFGQLQGVLTAETLKSSHRPDGKIAEVLASTLSCTTADDAMVNYRLAPM